MGKYQKYKGNSENKLFYIIDNLIGGINTEYSDDYSDDREFKSLINFDIDKKGSLTKRKGFGKLNAVSKIFNLIENIPEIKGKEDDNQHPEETNDNVVYAKLLINDNGCYRNLSAFEDYREYQRLYGSQNNKFSLLMITTNYDENISKAWIIDCTLPALQYDTNGKEKSVETIVATSTVTTLPVLFKWDRNLMNIETIEMYDKIYFTDNNIGLVSFDRTARTFKCYGLSSDNKAYKPSPMEIRKVGFNVLGNDPLHWIDYQGISTDSIQGVYLTSVNDIPLTNIPSGDKFYLNILYTGNNNGFSIEFKEGDTTRDATTSKISSKCSTGLDVYEVAFKTQPSSNTEIKITKTNASISPYYDYYDVASIDNEAKKVEKLNIGSHNITEMYNRAVYYKDDTIWFSEINNFDYVPNYNYVSLPLEPTDEITKISYFKGVYIVFTKQRIYKMINSFGDSDFAIMPINMGIGCNAPNTVVPIENVLYFASPRGLYELVSNNNYASSGVTFENVKPLDEKVKSLTSDVTLYLKELKDPSIRYSGISKYAYGVRYKDKYILFFNTSYEKGDIAAVKDIDALVYKYDIKAFSEIRFPIKPTFMFMVDGSIQTFATVKQKKDFNEEETLINYNFETTNIVNGKIEDLSDNNLDATVSGYLISAPGVGLNLSGNGYVKSGNITNDIRNGIDVNIDCDINELSSGSLMHLKQETPIAASTNESVTITSNYTNGYAGKIVCNIVPNVSTNEAVVNWTFYWLRESTSINAKYNGEFSLVDNTSNKTLISAKAFNFDFGTATQVSGGTGTFTISYDTTRNYSKEWELKASSKYPVYVNNTGWDNGSAKSIGQELNLCTGAGGTGTSYSWMFMGFSGSAYISSNGKCTLAITPYVRTTSALYVGSREAKVNVNGTEYSTTIGAISTSSGATAYGGTIYADVSYNGEISIGISGRYYVNATISGTSRGWVYTKSFSQQLPKTQSYTYQTTTWESFSISKKQQVALKKLSNLSYREINISLDSSNEHRLNIFIDNEYYSYSGYVVNDNKSVKGRYNWSIKIVKQSSNYRLSIYRNTNDLFGYIDLDSKYIVDGNRNDCKILKGIKSSLYGYEVVYSNTTVIKYAVNEGSGTTLIDSSTNSKNGTISGTYSWQVEAGLKFGGGGYLSIPELNTNIPFTNGFSVEFEGKFNSISDAVKVFDFATGYDTGVSGTDKCSINCGILGNTISFMTTSSSKKTYKLEYSSLNLSSRHKWRFDVTDNGSGYDAKITLDNVVVYNTTYNYGGITNARRRNNYIGKSNVVGNKLLNGMLYNFKIVINKSDDPIDVFEGAMYEYDTTFDDFGKPMEIEIETKGINLQYPMHQKKIKNIFVKGLGGYSYSEFFLEAYSDGHLINDPRKYKAYIDETTGEVIYDYTETKELNFDEQQSLLGNIRLDKTSLGTTEYETKKIVIPSTKCKNMIIKIYGTSDDYLSIESLGFLFKLGKVKGEK